MNSCTVLSGTLDEVLLYHWDCITQFAFFFNTLMKVILKISHHWPLKSKDGDEKLNVDFVVIVLFSYAGKPFFFHSGSLQDVSVYSAC